MAKGVYTEYDQLSTAWQSCEDKLKSKVFELARLEDKARKAVGEVNTLSFLVLINN